MNYYNKRTGKPRDRRAAARRKRSRKRLLRQLRSQGYSPWIGASGSVCYREGSRLVRLMPEPRRGLGPFPRYYGGGSSREWPDGRIEHWDAGSWRPGRSDRL